MPTTPEKYSPSNGTEGEIFMARFCYQCMHQGAWDEDDDSEPCEILFQSMAGDEGPEEWIIATDGPTCTAFQHNDDSPIQYRCEKTEDMFK